MDVQVRSSKEKASVLVDGKVVSIYKINNRINTKGNATESGLNTAPYLACETRPVYKNC